MLLAPREAVIGEGRIGTDKNIILKFDTIPELHAAFDRDAVSNLNFVFDEDMVTYVALPTNASARQHVNKRPNTCSLTDFSRFNQCIRMLKGFVHAVLFISEAGEKELLDATT